MEIGEECNECDNNIWIKITLEQLESLRSDYTPAASCLPILLSHTRSQVKSYKFKEFAKILNFEILKETL